MIVEETLNKKKSPGEDKSQIEIEAKLGQINIFDLRQQSDLA